MKRFIAFFSLFCSLTTASAAELRVAAYFPEYRAAVFDAKAYAGLTDLIVFSGDCTAAGRVDLSRMKDVPWEKVHAFRRDAGARIILSLGGWNRSAGFAEVATSHDKRRLFAQACVKVCQEHELQGVDLDWEGPVGDEQVKAYGELLREMRKAFSPHGLKLSATIADAKVLPPAAYEAVDWVQIMSYDREGRHATYEGAVADVESLVNAGAKREQIILGMPFYGRHLTEREHILSYREIVAKFHPAPEDDEAGGYYFNGPATMRRKTEYAVRAGLGGVMVWELGQDAAGEASLVKVICDAAKRARE